MFELSLAVVIGAGHDDVQDHLSPRSIVTLLIFVKVRYFEYHSMLDPPLLLLYQVCNAALPTLV